MKKVIASILVVSITTMQLGGCANTGATQTQQGAAIGAVSGAALGAAVSKNKGKGALIGALIGLLVGAAIGNYRDQQDATRAEAAMKYRYDDRGNKLVVESAAVAPQAVSRGERLSLIAIHNAVSEHRRASQADGSPHAGQRTGDNRSWAARGRAPARHAHVNRQGELAEGSPEGELHPGNDDFGREEHEDRKDPVRCRLNCRIDYFRGGHAQDFSRSRMHRRSGACR